jgi:dTDP-glucose pyrophosphorylase
VIAVVLAAGRGTRLGGAVPKPLVRVAGVPVIDRILADLADDGFTDVVVVTGHEAAAVEAHLDGRGLRCVRQTEPAGTAHALAAARSALRDEAFLLSWGDVLVPAGTYRRIVAGRAGEGAVAVNHLDDVSSGGLVAVVGGEVSRITEKPDPVAGWNLTGVLALDEGIWRHIDTLERSTRGEYELPNAIDAWVDAGARIAAVPVLGPVFEVGTPAGRDAADAYFSSEER